MNMELDILKESSIEYCENIYALAANYLRKNKNDDLVYMMKELTFLKDDIRMCDNVLIMDGYKDLLEQIINKIEGIINE